MNRIFSVLVLLLFFGFSNAQESAPETTLATDGTLSVKFSTNQTATYSLAIFITNSTGALVNTMLYRTSNGKSSAQDMSTFWSKIGSSWSTSSTKLLTTADLDATSGATTSSAYTNKTIYWGKNASTVADGTYTVNFEMANYEPVNRRYTSGTFVKGATASTSTLTTIKGFTAPVITWTPNTTAINEVKASQYKCYPNPTKSTVYITGFDIQTVELLTLNGTSIFTTSEQKLNLSGLPKGIYLAKLSTSDGVFIKKIEKQ